MGKKRKCKIINRENVKIFLQFVVGVGVLFSIWLGFHNIKTENLRFRPFIVIDNMVEENEGVLNLSISNKGLTQAENINIETRIISKSGDCYNVLSLRAEGCFTGTVGRIVFTGNFEKPGEIIFELNNNEIFIQPEFEEVLSIYGLVSTSDPFITDVIGSRTKNFGVLNPDNSINLKILIDDEGLEKIKNDDSIFILGVNYRYNNGRAFTTHYSFFDYNEDENIFSLIRQEEIEK